MAELVDALGSGPSGSNLVQVRVLFWATKAGDWRKYAIFTSPPAFSLAERWYENTRASFGIWIVFP